MDRKGLLESLGRYRECEKELGFIAEELCTWNNRARRMAALRRAAGLGKGDMEQAAEKMACLQKQLARRLEELTDLRLAVEDWLGLVEDGKARLILELRYIGGLTFDEIAERVLYERSWVSRLHGRALQELTEKLRAA